MLKMFFEHITDILCINLFNSIMNTLLAEFVERMDKCTYLLMVFMRIFKYNAINIYQTHSMHIFTTYHVASSTH